MPVGAAISLGVLICMVTLQGLLVSSFSAASQMLPSQVAIKGSSVVSLYRMYLEFWFPRAAYHWMTYGAIQMASPACTEYLHSKSAEFAEASVDHLLGELC